VISTQESDGAAAVAQLPAALQRWMTLERFHLHQVEKFQRMSRDPSFDTAYLPQNGGVFRLPTYRVSRRHLHSLGGQPKNTDAMRFVTGEESQEQVLFPIHPTALGHYREFLLNARACDVAQEGLCIWAMPTSSSRTLLAWLDGAPQSAVFVKTSLYSPLFGDRRIRRAQASRSVTLSAMLDSEADELPHALAHLPEILAFTTRQAPHTGAIVRAIPDAIKTGRVRLAPLFSLLGSSGDHVPLLLTILERTGMPPLQFVHDVLCKPFAQLWLELSMNFGWILEAHGQDLLLELSPELDFQGRFHYRDFEGLQVDWQLRRWLGRATPPGMPHAWEWHDAYDSLGNYPYCGLLWYKWRTSLFQYLHFVLHETEASLREWHRRGLIGGRVCAEDEATAIFSGYLFAALEQMFNVRVGPPYNVYRFLNRFLLLLTRLRRQALGPELSHSQPRVAGFAA
jgi:hypothetical protein